MFEGVVHIIPLPLITEPLNLLTNNILTPFRPVLKPKMHTFLPFYSKVTLFLTTSSNPKTFSNRRRESITRENVR
jgi:hypothetical protein